MPLEYTGDPAGVQPPAAAPGPDVLPIFNLPADGDPDAASTFEQCFKVAADYIAWLVRRNTDALFGKGGSAGTTVTLTGSTSIETHTEYENLIVDDGAAVDLRAPIWVRNTLTIRATGLIDFSGPDATASVAGVGYDTGTGGWFYMRGGTSGGTAGVNGGAGVAFAEPYVFYGGKGGAGGAGDGVAGAGGNPAWSCITPVGADMIGVPGCCVGPIQVGSYFRHGVYPLAGGTGGGAGGASASGGGGGGAGGGAIWIAARNVVLESGARVCANGGAGGAGSGGGGSGGGGGGGTICLVFQNYTISGAETIDQILLVNGGLKGGAGAADGAAGRLILAQVRG